MNARELPARPRLEQYRKQAKELLKQSKAADPDAVERLRQHHPRLAGRSDGRDEPDLTLADVQLVLAREHGFESWPKFAKHLQGGHPFAGRWTANLARSIRHPGNQFRRATLEFDITGDTVTITDVVVDESGREERNVNTIRADGREHPSERGHGYALTARWHDAHMLETVATQHGAIVGRGTYRVSPDGKTMTISDATGDQTVVLERD